MVIILATIQKNVIDIKSKQRTPLSDISFLDRYVGHPKRRGKIKNFKNTR